MEGPRGVGRADCGAKPFQHHGEQSDADREAILDAIFSRSRAELVAAVAAAGAGAARERAERALRAHDYVYDVFDQAQGVAA